MVSLLGPILANIFMSHLEKHNQLSAIFNRTLFCERYIDNTFYPLFATKNDVWQIFS